ncbi:pentapeptide repeat-containing protein [Crocosphaera sp. XPORK-15E]|uniref:pentapeptide repeat-containing protein n=1 Tax=Crocosphaera sp. XPORK-15E TaxID=3110247 RepID=UPI002B1F426C|nr:pentapeptide repeat-containing protein [Crocosphaera sp. XPORK-15E]MEA5534254.1 pentapeptide repeat-containing protein [Crocosphaera sp. XPORK-15E]
MYSFNYDSEFTEINLLYNLENTTAELIIKESLLVNEVVNFKHKKRKVQKVLGQLKKLAGNVELTIDKVEGEELTIKIEGSEVILNQLKNLFISGEFTEISGVVIKDFNLVNINDSPLDNILEFDPQSRLIQEIMTQGANDRDLREVNLSGANLSQATFILADLRWANFMGADLSGANFMGADLSGADLIGADLSGANLMGAKLTEANLKGADLSQANLQEVDLSWADLSEVNLIGANLSQANLKGAILSGSILSRTNLSGSNLSEAILSSSILSRTDLSGSNLSETNLSEAYLSEANLSGVNLEKTKVNHAQFGNNQGINDILKQDLIEREAIF